MSTRSIIVITGTSRFERPMTARLYKHSDGYPSGNLPIIRDALVIALAQHREQAAKFSEKTVGQPNVEQLIGLVIGASTSVYGIGADLDRYDDDGDMGLYDVELKPEHFGTQGDLEWIYLVNLATKEVLIYGGDPAHLELADPLAGGRPAHRDEVLQLIKSIKALGFNVRYKGAK